MINEANSFCPSNRLAWRDWLKQNHEKESAVWLIIYKKGSELPNLSWSEAVDEALCFGWIDSTKRPIDSEKYKQYFTKRKAKSPWSKINKEKVKKLVESGQMTEAGLRPINKAKQDGSWTMADGAENLEIPSDLEEQLNQNPGSLDFFNSLSKSARKSMLHWVGFAKRPETRKKRIGEIVKAAAKREKPKNF